MVADPSWLYNIIARSAAAIVATISGFMTASVLNLLSGKRNSKHQPSDKETRLKKIKEQFKERYEWREAEYLDKRGKLFLEADITDLKRRIGKSIYPPNLVWGILILGYLAASGVLFPVSIIAYQAFFTWAKIFTMVSFFLGVIGLFAYVVFQIRTLRRRHTHATG